MPEYPSDWLERRDGEPASDLDLVVLLINSLDLLADPPDRLADLSWFQALAARLPAALAECVASRGLGRLGTCAAPPCHCAFVDRTRARTRRYCCTACNDRTAARLYRQRTKS